MDKKFFEYDGYVQIDPNSGQLTVLKDNGEPLDLVESIFASSRHNLGARITRRIKIKVYEMTPSETSTAQSVFSWKQGVK